MVEIGIQCELGVESMKHMGNARSTASSRICPKRGRYLVPMPSAGMAKDGILAKVYLKGRRNFRDYPMPI